MTSSLQAELLPFSTLDYPGQLAAVLFFRGCNLRCPYCHNPGLLRGGNPGLSWEELRSFLQKRRGRLDALVISGGEASLRPELPEYLREIRAFGYKIKLDTNGTRPQVLQELLEAELLDYVALDYKDLPSFYPSLSASLGAPGSPTEDFLSSWELLRKSGLHYELRTTVYRPRFDLGLLQEMGRLLQAGETWWLQEVQTHSCLRPESVQALAAGWLQDSLPALQSNCPAELKIRRSQAAL